MIHEFDSHVWRAFDAWPKPKDRKKYAKEVKSYDDQLSTVIYLLINRVKDMDDISFEMAEFCLVMEMVHKKTIYCPGFDLCSTTQDTYDEDEAIMLELEIKKRMDKTAKIQRIRIDEEMETRISEVMKVNDKINKQHFRGKEKFRLMKNDLSDSVTFSMAYLKSVDSEKNSCMIKVDYVFHLLGCDGEIEPQVIEGFHVEVSLPFEGGSLNKFMTSHATHRYLDEEWYRKLALFVRTAVTMVQKADNMKLAANNQFMEGMINNEKTSLKNQGLSQ